MKNRWKTKSLLAALTLAVVASLAPVTTPQASAEEIYTGHPLRWTVKVGAYWGIRVNYTQLMPLGSVYRNTATAACKNWMAVKQAYCVISDYSTSNVDMVQASTAFWTDHKVPSNVVAWEVSTDSAGHQIFTAAEAATTTGRVAYAAIYFAPTTNKTVAASATYQTNVIMHEIGHVYGMGHTTANTDLMWGGGITAIMALSSADQAVMASFYK